MQGPQEPLISRPMSWRRRWKWLGPLAATGGGAILVAGVLLWAHTAATPSSAYHYRFQRLPRGAVKQALQREIEFYQARLTYDPNSGLNLASLASAYLRMARVTGDLSWYLLAEQAAQRSVASLPFQNSGALIVLAKVAEARHDFDESIHLAHLAGIDDALSIVVTSNLAMGHVDEAARAAATLVDGSPSLGDYTLRALADMAQGRDDDAVIDFQQALAVEEADEVATSALTRTLFGRLYYRRGHPDRARLLYEEALQILPQYALALSNLAELEIRQSQYRLAEEHLTQIVTITKASPNVYDHVLFRGLARLKELEGDSMGAEKFWLQAEERLRQDAASGKFGHRRELARLLLERGRPQDIAEVLRLMEQEIRIRQDADTLDVYAWALTRAGRWSDAREVMKRALRWGFRDARFFYRAAAIEQSLGDPAQARQFIQRAQETDPAFDEKARLTSGLGY